MANTMAMAVGIDRSRDKEVHRLGSEAARVVASTWQTFAKAYVNKDGSGEVEVTQNGRVIHRFEFGPENGEENE